MMKHEVVPQDPLIHLVDHDIAALHQLFEELSRAGYRVNASSVSETALAFIQRRKPEIVLCNLHMPVIDGLELLEKVKRISPHTRVIFMSSCGEWAVYKEVCRRGAFDLVPRPVTPKTLRRVLGRLLDCEEARTNPSASRN